MINFFTYGLHITTTKHRKTQYTFPLIILHYQPNTVKLIVCNSLTTVKEFATYDLWQPNRPIDKNENLFCKWTSMFLMQICDSLEIYIKTCSFRIYLSIVGWVWMDSKIRTSMYFFLLNEGRSCDLNIGLPTTYSHLFTSEPRRHEPQWTCSCEHRSQMGYALGFRFQIENPFNIYHIGTALIFHPSDGKGRSMERQLPTKARWIYSWKSFIMQVASHPLHFYGFRC